jgi:hypothetical protein
MLATIVVYAMFLDDRGDEAKAAVERVRQLPNGSNSQLSRRRHTEHSLRQCAWRSTGPRTLQHAPVRTPSLLQHQLKCHQGAVCVRLSSRGASGFDGYCGRAGAGIRSRNQRLLCAPARRLACRRCSESAKEACGMLGPFCSELDTAHDNFEILPND